MHTFKFHIPQEILRHAYNAIHDASRQDRFQNESPIPSKQYALEVALGLPDGIDAHNLRMQVKEYPLEQALTIPSVEFDVIPPDRLPPTIIAVRKEPLKELSGAEYERMRVSEEEQE